MSAETISLITARAAKMEKGSGGIPDVTEADICHAIALLRCKGAGLLLRVKIAGQETFRFQLVDELAKRHSSKSELSYIAVDEYCAPALCRTCNGRESHRIGDLLIVCQACNGSGKHRHIDPRERIGATMGQWRRLEGIYSDMLGRLSVWESIGIAAINSIQHDETT